jgi:hypothetical protein
VKFKQITTVLALSVLMFVAVDSHAVDTLDAAYTYSTPSGGQFEGDVDQHEFKIDGMLPFWNADDFEFDQIAHGIYQLNIWNFDDSRVAVLPGLHTDVEDVGSDSFRVDGMYVAGAPTGGERNVETRDKQKFDLQQKGSRVGIGGDYRLERAARRYVPAGTELERELGDNGFIQIGYRINQGP